MIEELRIEILKLSMSERIQLVQDIWDSIVNEKATVPLTDAQRKELDYRLALAEQEPPKLHLWEDVKARLLEH